ncbi:hypothetical protein [Streptomyces albipurpureus]|uniref:Secreted protein n=1 Tax=Streptomyces albipurpureus TaxID=2897419 RepID=A0ABT0UJL4_9ACTN|nr:hypothetical protein [Streptomyces sp. CWNU-1]MCM2388194.1 hypothetical protein [Streptomyces sp. CWNU-1]
MSVRKVFATVTVAAAMAGAGLMTAPTAQAAPQAASVVGPTNWSPRGDYATPAECDHAGRWFVSWGGASIYECAFNATTQRYHLRIWRV